MAAIRRSGVTIRPVWQVDCKVCNEAVEPDALNTINGAFTDRDEAAEAKENHLEEHKNGVW